MSRYMDFCTRRYDEEDYYSLTTVNGTLITSYVPQTDMGDEGQVIEAIEISNLSTLANMRATKGELERFFELARIAQRDDSAPRAFLRYEYNSGGAYQSEVLDGKVDLLHSTQSVEWLTGRHRLLVTLTRRNYFEADEEVQLLIGIGGAATTDPVTIDNGSNATPGEGRYDDFDNVLDFDADNIAGDLSAPIKLLMEHDSGDSGEQTEVWIGHNVFSDPLNMPRLIEGEAATGGGIDTPDEDCSGGYYNLLQWSAEVETKLAEWSLDGGTLLKSAQGGLFGVFAHLQINHTYSDLYLRLQIRNTPIYDLLWQTELLLVPNKGLLYLGNLRLPPYKGRRQDTGAGTSDPADLVLELYALRDVSGTKTLKLDYFMLVPISDISGLTCLTAISTGIDETEYLVVDEINKDYYRLNASGEKCAHAEWIKTGKGVHLLPGRDQRLVVASFGGSYTEPLAQLWNVTAYYRPRRRTI